MFGRGDTGFCMRISFLCRLAFAAVLLVCLALPVAAQAPDDEVHITPRVEKTQKPEPTATPENEDPGLSHSPIRVNVDLVLIPVTVTDPMNRLVTGLETDNFAITEAGVKQSIKYFSSEDEPISLGLIFDISGSMANKILRSREAAVEFFKTANPQDEFFVVTFNDRPQLLEDFTKSVADIQEKIAYVIPKGRTALFDAIYMGINKMEGARNPRKALLIISDGGDNSSRYTQNEIRSLVKEADVQIYSIGLFEQNAPTIEERNGPALLEDISNFTGGRMFWINDPSELADVATKISVELRNQYVLGYRPTNPVRDGKWRKVKVKLIPPKGLPSLNVHSRTGYYAPSQ